MSNTTGALRGYLARRPGKVGRSALLRLAAVALVVLTAFAGLTPQPASALTSNEKFVWAFFTDFLLRSPDSDEVSTWTTYLASGTRSGMAASLLDSSEFKDLWVVGASLYYLDVVDPATLTISDTLDSNDDFVASEVSLIAGTAYFTNSGGTNTSFVQKLYLDTLQRTVDSTALSYWVGRLNAGTATRSYTANYIIRSNESALRRVGGAAGMTSCPTIVLEDGSSLVAGSYCIVLDRLADSSGLTYWSGQLSATDQLPSLWVSLSASTEYFNKAQARF